MAVKRKHSEAGEISNERHLRSRTGSAKSALKSYNSKLRSSLSPSKAVLKDHVAQNIVEEDFEIPSDKMTNPVDLNTHHKTSQIYASEDTIIHSPRTPKRKKVLVEIPISPSKYQSINPVSHARRHVLHENAVMDGSDAFSIQLHVCLAAQKREMLRTLRTSSFDGLGVPTTEVAARKQLSELIQGSMTRGEGNSCIVLGPRGSGKTRIVESCIHNLAAKPIVLRLTGWVQTTDKQALREIATQLLHQTGSYLLSDTEPPDPTIIADDDDDGNPFIEQTKVVQDTDAEQNVRLPPSSQLHALIPVLLTLKRPVIVILDAFDLFALHPRQSLLYCLLDNVQSCRSTSGSQGIAIIGITSRVDTIQLLEKRVKSRFSGRIIRTAPPDDLEHWLRIAKNVLLVPITLQERLHEQWHKKWTSSVEAFLSDPKVLGIFNETFEISKDVKVFIKVLTQSILHLRPDEPYLSFETFFTSVESQRSRPRHTHVNNLSYPMICLIIASSHVEITGHATFSFEMLFEKFRDQVRASTSAPVQLNGGHVGMVKCTREVLVAAFDKLVSSHIFLPCIGPSTTTAKEFIKHRCVLDRNMMKKIVEKSGQIHLKKWFNKA